MLEWSPSLPPKMPICLDLVNKLCSISNSSIHWKLTLFHWCHAEIHYGDPDMIDNSLRSSVSGHLCCILSNNFQHMLCSNKLWKWPSLLKKKKKKKKPVSYIYILVYSWRRSPTFLKVVKQGVTGLIIELLAVLKLYNKQNHQKKKFNTYIIGEKICLLPNLRTDQCRVLVWDSYWIEAHQIFNEWYNSNFKLFYEKFTSY